MKAINKKSEPNSLTKYRLQPNATYDGPNFTPIKNDIRVSLLIEQGYICAYCMRRISISNMKVEHWACQHANPTLQLSYKNLLGCCNGNEGNPPKDQTCDTSKGGQLLSYSPSESTHRIESKVMFSLDGRILSDDVGFDEELNTVLNLNHARLKRNRELQLEALQGQLNHKQGRRTRQELQSMFTTYNSVDSTGKFREYCGMFTWYLKKRIVRTP